MKRATLLFSVLFLSIFTLTSTALAANTDIVIKEIQGLVQVQKQGNSDWVKPEENSTVTSGDKVRSFLESSALLVFPNGGEFRLRENTSLDVKDISENAINKTAQRALKLNLGSLHYKVPPKKEKTTEFKIYSSTSIVGITGTEGVITAKGEGKSSENILLEGATYDTDIQGQNGYYQKSGNVYKNDGLAGQLFSADVREESALRGAIDEEYLTLIKEAVTSFKAKRDEGRRVGQAEALIKQAFFYLEKREYALVRQTVEQANGSLAKAKKVSLPDNLDEKIADMVIALDAKEAEGYDVEIPSALLGKAQSLKQTGEFGDIKQILTQAEKELAIVAEGAPSGEAEAAFWPRYQNVERRVLEKGQQGFSTGENKALLREAKIFYEQGEKPRAYLLLKEAEDKLALVLKNVSDAFVAKVARLEGEIADKKAASYPTKELELRLEKVKVYIREENFLKARESVASIEDGLATLRKGISADWQRKISDLKKSVNYKRSTGYDLAEIPGLIGEIEQYQAEGDLVNLEDVYKKAVGELAKVKLPGGLQADWKAFQKRVEKKNKQGYNLKEINDLSAQIKTAMDGGDIKSARTFLSQAKKTLDEVKDQDPPKVQVISFTESEEAITVEGYASDNTKIKNVSVNHFVIEVDKEGKFQFATTPNPSLKKLSILAADIEGNISAPVVLPLTVKGEIIDSQLKLANVTAEYGENTLIIKGRFAPGGKVKVGDIETVCDAKGQFNVKVKLARNKDVDSIAVAGILSDDQFTEEILLPVEDKWTPRVNVTKVAYDNSFVPALNVEPLTYNENTLSVAGQVVLTQMANIEGRAFDLGGEIESLKIEGTDVDIREDGLFNASLTIDRSRKNAAVKLVAIDQAGNTTETEVALDPNWSWPSLRINNAKTFQKSLGKFSSEISLTADMTDIAIVLENAEGETIISKRLPVAAVLPPELEIQDIHYEGENIIISGRSTADGTVSDKNKVLFKDDVAVTKDAVFTMTAEYPPVDEEIIFVAANIEGKLSQDVKAIVGPPKDVKAPVLYLSAPQKDKQSMIIQGFVEDDSEVDSLTVGGMTVEIAERGNFSYTIASAEGMDSVEVKATDIFGNEATRIVVFNDKEKPSITINTWEAKDGRLVIAGKATDNIAVKQVRLNAMPIAVGETKEMAFSYNGALTADSKEAVIVAVDLLNNETREGPREITIPTDETAPKGKSIGMKYGSPIVYASGSVVDPAGVKAVYVNGEEVELYDDGTFNIKVSIDVGVPKLEMESPAYDEGKLIIVGKAMVGDFTPAKITVEAEDLSGNRGILFSQDVSPYQLNEMEVSINGEIVDVNGDGSFRYEQPIALGQRFVEIKTADPFDNTYFETQTLEDKKPVLELQPLEYNAKDETILLSGKAQDEGSGLYTVNVNGIRTDVGGDGSFTYKTTFNQRALNVVVSDYIGNETSLTKEVKPPDVWPPVFSLSVTPVPAIVGDPVYVEIAALDSKTRLPEILKGAPTVKAEAGGTPVTVTVAGEGANYIATLQTTGLDASLVAVSIEGEDEAGNKSSEIEGTDAFALVADDLIAPSFTIETTPSPVELGVAATVKVLASEDLKVMPSLTATLPSGGANPLTLSESGAGTYQASLTVRAEEGIGTVLLKLSGGEDLSGNMHDVTETAVGLVAPLRVTEIPLNINVIDFVTERFVLNGQTASEAIVHIEVGRYVQDIVADAQGVFRFERPVSLIELEDMYTLGASVKVRLKAHNYAGFESRQKFFEVPLPPLPTVGGGNFEIRLSPLPVGQGGFLNISVTSQRNLSTPPKGFLYLPGGQRVAVSLQGRDVFSGQYAIPETTSLGTGMFEVVSNDMRESVPFDVVLSDQWMQRLNKYDFFRIRTAQDPLIVGQRAEFFVETMGDLPQPPRLEIRFPNGRRDSIPLSGSQRFFQGSYMAPVDVVPGMAELILNPGTPQEIRRPYGIEDAFTEGDFVDAFLFANPNPLIGGEPYNVNVSFSQQILFRPRLVLKLQNGRIIEMPLEGSAPSSKFMARGNLPSDVEPGLAKFVLLDDRGVTIDRFPAQISAPFSTSTGKDIFITQGMLHRMETATIQLNSVTPVYGRIEAHVSFPDGTRKVVLLEGTEMLRKGVFTVPDYVPVGTVTISVFDQYGMVGNINAQVVDYEMTGEPVHIYLNNPDFQPYDYVRLNVETNWPLSTIPKAELIWDGGSLRITLTGQVPGNRFSGEFMAPKDLITHGRIEVRDAQGAMIGDLPIDRGPEGEGEIIVTPMPPVIGQPLSIKVVAPSVVNTAPMMRLIFDDDTRKELNAYGPIPGDTFIASLALLEKPLRMIEIVHEGVVVESIPVEYLSMTNFDFMVSLQDPMIVPCDITDVIVRANSYVPFTPYLSADFNGRIIDVPLSKMSPMEFLGRMSVPCDVSFTNYDMRLFDPQGKLLWQRNFISDTTSTSSLQLHAMPLDANSVELSWNMISGVDGYEIRYGETAALGRTISAGNVSNFAVPGLTTGKTYFFKVAARKSYQDVMVSDIINMVVGGTTLELNPNFNVTDNDINLYWGEYPGADKYRVQWGLAVGVYPNMRETTAPNYFIQDLAMGTGYYVKVQALQSGTVIGESRDIYVYIEKFMSSGGEIYFNPDPPTVGSQLYISMHFFEDLPFIPKVVVRMTDRDVTLVPTGSYRDYTAILTAAEFNTAIEVVDVLDTTGNIIAAREVGGGTYGGDMVPIEVTPDPPRIGATMQVKVNFPDPVPFTPKLVIEFASGVKPYFFNQAPYMYTYEWYIPVADMNSSVLYMKVVDPTTGTLLAEKDFDEWQGDEYADAPFVVVPNPTIVGQSVSMTLDTDVVVSMAPRLRIYYEYSSTQEVAMTGTLPGQHFTYNIGSLSSRITTIDIIDPSTNTVKHTWLPAESNDPTSSEIIVPYDPPLVNQTLYLKAQFPGAVSYTPKVRVYFTNNDVKYYTFPQSPGLSMYERYIPGADITSNVDHIQIWNEAGTLMVGERFFSKPDVSVTSITVSDDQPASGDTVYLYVYFNVAPGFTPQWQFETQEGGIYSGAMTMMSDNYYTGTIDGWSGAAMEVEILDDGSAFIPNGHYDFIGGADVSVTSITVSEDQPASGDTVYLYVYFDGAPGFTPQWQFETQEGGIYSGAMTMMSDNYYTGTIDGWSGTAMEVEILDDGSAFIPNGHYDFIGGADVSVTSITVSEDQPASGDTVYLYVYFDGAPGFTPQWQFETQEGGIYSGAMTMMSDNYYTGTIDGWSGTAMEVEILDDGSAFIPNGHYDFSGTATTFEIDLTTVGSNEIEVCWPVEEWIDSYQIFYRTDTGSYGSPIMGVTSCYILGNNETLTPGETYYILVEGLMGGTVEQSDEDFINLTVQSVPTPTGVTLELPDGTDGQIKVTWNTVPEAEGYHVYYGISAEPNSYDSIDDNTLNNYTITGLVTNYTYYIRVRAYIGATESNYEQTLSSVPSSTSGGGGLVPAPATVDISGNPGDTKQTNVGITNNGSPAFVRVKATALSDGGSGFIDYTHYTFTPNGNDIAGGGGYNDFTVQLQIPAGASVGSYTGHIKFYADTNPANGMYDSGEAFVDVPVTLSLTSGSVGPFDHVAITADKSSSPMGSPIFITLEAQDSSGNRVTTYSSDVEIQVSELTPGLLPESWILSLNGEPGGSATKMVLMYNGVGNFTLDAQEPEELSIDVTNVSAVGDPLNLTFTPRQEGSVATKWAIVAPSTALIGLDGVEVWIAAVDGQGKIITTYTGGTVNLSTVEVGGSVPSSSAVSPSSYTFDGTEDGQIEVTLSDSEAETVTLTAAGSLTTANIDIDFAGATQYLLNGSSGTQQFVVDNAEIPLLLQAADGSGNVVRGYNGAAKLTILNIPSGSVSLTGGNNFSFEDGIAEVILYDNTAPDTVIFKIEENPTSGVETGEITASFQFTDATPPEIVRVEMDTPWIVHVYFSENVTSATAGEEGFYDVGVNINKVCWYGDNVTLHLDNIPGGGLGGSFDLEAWMIMDDDGLWLGYDPGDPPSTPYNSSTTVTFTGVSVPTVDYQGAAYTGGTDWFEVQVSDTNPSQGDTVRVTIYHKNVCGYLTGENNDNKNTDLSSITINYDGSLGIGGLTGGPDESGNISSGKLEFNVTAGFSSGTVTISASGSGVSTQLPATITIP